MDNLDLRHFVAGILHGEQNNDLDSLADEPVKQLVEMSQRLQFACLAPWDCEKNGWNQISWGVKRNMAAIQTALEYTLVRNAYDVPGWINSIFAVAKPKMPNLCTLSEFGHDGFSVSVEQLDNFGLPTPLIRIQLCEDTLNEICDKVFNKEFCDSLHTRVSDIFDESRFLLDNTDEPSCVIIPNEIISAKKLRRVIDLRAKFKAYLLDSLDVLRTGLSQFFLPGIIESLLESLVFNHFIYKKFLDGTNHPIHFNSFHSHVLPESGKEYATSQILGGALTCLLVIPRTFPSESLNHLLADIHCISSALLAKVAVTQNRFWYQRSYQSSLQSAISALMSRNMSHNLGSHVITNVKHQIEDLEKRQGDESVAEQLRGLTCLFQYLQERQDFIATIANDEYFPRGPLNFKSAVFDILAMDGPAYRHDSDTKINNYILDNIVRSENVARHGSLSGNANPGAIAIELQLVKVDARGRVSAFKSIGSQKIGNEFSDMLLSVNSGLNGRQALLIIFENIIRNAAKHGKESLNRLDTLVFSVIFKECRDADTGKAYYEITIADNKKDFTQVREKLSGSDGDNPPFIKDDRIAPLNILREDGGGIPLSSCAIMV